VADGTDLHGAQVAGQKSRAAAQSNSASSNLACDPGAAGLSVRLPSGEDYVPQVSKEHRWLPVLAGQLPLPIPEPVALGRPAESPGFVTSPLARSSPAVICNAGHALAGHAAVDLRALSGSALVGYPLGWEVRTLSDRALRSSGVEPRYAFEVNDTRTLLDLVEIGLGVAVFPEALAAPRSAQLREIAISGRRWD
jgi:DNA-binding transcriptional LysR family regulator